MSTPADIVNRVLDGLGRSDIVLGDLQEGTEGAKPALRAYGPAVRQLLRAAHWDWSRKFAPLVMLGDATGQTPNVGTLVTPPWTYEYQLPIDCMKARFLPWNSQPVSPTPPIMTGLGNPPLNALRLIPAPFLVALDYNYPVVVGQPPAWDAGPNWWDITGTGPSQRTVILTNVNMAWLVYTALVVYPSQWDSLFEEALVQVLIARLAMSLVKDKKFALQVKNEAIAAAKQMLSEARAANANESGFPQTTDHTPAWMRARNAGTGWGSQWGGALGGYAGPGVLGYGWDAMGFGDGNVY